MVKTSFVAGEVVADQLVVPVAQKVTCMFASTACLGRVLPAVRGRVTSGGVVTGQAQCTAIGGCAVGVGRRFESVAAAGSKRPAEVGYLSLYVGKEQTICDGRLDVGDRTVRVIQKRKPRLEAGAGVSWSTQGVVSFRSLELSANHFSILRRLILMSTLFIQATGQ